MDDIPRLLREQCLVTLEPGSRRYVKVKEIFDATIFKYDIRAEDIYAVNIGNQTQPQGPQDKFLSHMLWHGTKWSNMTGILEEGLKCYPKNGRIPSISFADMVAKSLFFTDYENQYDKIKCVFLLCQVDLGKSEETDSLHVPGLQRPSNGFNTWKINGAVFPEFKKGSDELLYPCGQIQQEFMFDDDGNFDSLAYNQYIVYEPWRVKVCYMVKADFVSTDDPPPMMPSEDIEQKAADILRRMEMTENDRVELEESTREQHACKRYVEERKNRLTSSQFGMICKRRPTTSCHGHATSILYNKPFTTEHTEYGQKNEPKIRDRFAAEYGKTVRKSGLYVDAKYPFLASSPDGIVLEEDAVIEIKCFPSLKKWRENENQKNRENGEKTDSTNVSLIKEAAASKPGFPLSVNKTDGTLEINKKHRHYYQIQGQLRTTCMKKCYYIAFASEEEPLTVVIVEEDSNFINEMVEKLLVFYKTCVLPEIVLRRAENGKWRCLDPDYIEEAISKKELEDQKKKKQGKKKQKKEELEENDLTEAIEQKLRL